MAKVALLVGVSEYERGLNPLPGAVKDVDAVREVLLHSEMGGFAESDILLLKNPDRQDVEESIETLFSGRHKDDLVLLYFSGHGIKDDRGRLYLATRTTRKTIQGELMRSTAVSANFIHARMSESRSRRQVVILDSCFSGAFAEGLSAKDDGNINIREQLGGEGRAVLTSSSSTQYSFEEKGQDLSIYTRFLIEGITSGEADRDEDEFISIDELHEYASQKVRELQPAMKPEIYAIREGFKIRLAKVAPGDPKQRYRKEVVRFIHRGELSFVGRRTLDVLKTRLGLEATEAKAIEDEVLEPYRKEFREKLQQYEQVFTELLKRDEMITESDRHDLQNLQQILGLRNEDTVPIEAQITARFKAHRENLQAYEQAFGSAVWQEYPLSAANHERLRQMQQQLNLTAAEVEAIESRITAQVQAYHQKLLEYECLFVNATQQEYPLNEASRANLCQQQQRLGLKDVEIAPIEAQITTQIETYHQKLQQYEQAYVKATQHKHYPDEVTRKQLQQTWQTLELTEEDIRAIESRINAAIKTHQVNLQQYEQKFAQVAERQYPVSEEQRNELKQCQRALNLADEDVVPIETRLTDVFEEHRQKLQQYEQVFRDSIQFEYPLNDATREELRRFQQILELKYEEVNQIEKKNIPQEETEENAQYSLKSDVSNSIENSEEQKQEVDDYQKLENQSQQHLIPNHIEESLQSEQVSQKNLSSAQAFSHRFFQFLRDRARNPKWRMTGLITGLACAVISPFIYTQVKFNTNPLNLLSSLSHLETTLNEPSPIMALALKPNDNTLITGGRDWKIKVLDLGFAPGKVIRNLEGHSGIIEKLSISPDGRTLASSSSDETIKIWDLGTGQVIRTLTSCDGLNKVSFSLVFAPDSQTLIISCNDGTIKVWNLASGQFVRTLQTSSKERSLLAISPDGKTLVSVSNDTSIVWELISGKKIRTWATGTSDSTDDNVHYLTISPDGKTLFTRGMGRRLKAWNLSDGQLMYSLDQSQIGFGDMTISPDGKTLVVAEGFGNNINVWDLKSQKKISTLYGHSGAVTSVVFRSNNELVSASMDGTIKLWKLH